jgi:predicted amino acid racemase
MRSNISQMSHADVTLPRHLFRYEAHDEAMRVARGDELLLNRQYPTRQQIDIVLTHAGMRRHSCAPPLAC